MHILDAFDGGDEVECDLAVLDADILGMEIAFGETVVIAADTVLQLFLHLETAMDDQRTTRLYQF